MRDASSATPAERLLALERRYRRDTVLVNRLQRRRSCARDDMTRLRISLTSADVQVYEAAKRSEGLRAPKGAA